MNLQKKFHYKFTRKPKMYWHDLYFLFAQVEKNESRPWCWFDERNPEGAQGIYKKFPKAVVLSGWAYSRGKHFNKNK